LKAFFKIVNNWIFLVFVVFHIEFFYLGSFKKPAAEQKNYNAGHWLVQGEMGVKLLLVSRLAETLVMCYNIKIYKSHMKTLKQFLFVLALSSFILASLAYPAAAQYEAQNDGVLIAQSSDASTAKNTNVFPLPGSSLYGDVPAPTVGASAQAQFQELTWGVVQNIRYIIGAIAILFIVYAGVKMVVGYGNEEVYTKQRNTILYSIIGLAIVGLSGEMANILSVSCPEFTDPTMQKLSCTQGGFLRNPNEIVRTSVLFNQTTKLVITFVKYFIGAVTVLMIVRNGMRLVSMGSDDTKVAQDKKNLFYSILGLILIIVSDSIINNVFYKIDLTQYPSTSGAQPGVDAVQGVKEIVGVTNFIVSIVGPLAVLVLVAGGIMYMTAGGDDAKSGKAKKMIFSALIGIVIIYGAFAIVSTFISGNIGTPST
jgi:hypothetical protein